ncbi:MAG: NAD(P)-dependent oxidoreductase [Polyangiales bacterium]
MPNVVLHASSRDPFFDLPASFEAALRAALPAGFALEVVREVAGLGAALRNADVYVGWALPPSFAKRSERLRYAYFLQAGVPEGWETATNKAGLAIRFDSAAGVNADSVADHALFLVLAGLRGVLSGSLGAGWAPAAHEVARDPRTMEAVVFGHGHVGRGVVARLRPLFREVHVVSHTPHEASAHEPRIHGFDETEAVVAHGDVVVLALPSTGESRALFSTERFFERLPRGAIVVNVARGDLLREDDLLAFLERAPEARYLADVATPEPYPADGALLAHPRVLLTPHVAGRRSDLWEGLARAASATLGAELPSLFSEDVDDGGPHP